MAEKEYDRFDGIAPLDYRYWDEELAAYFSENAFIKYKLRVELALVKALARRGVCSNSVVQEVERACAHVTAAAVYEEEDHIRHDIRALVNCIRERVSDKAKPYVHLTATSNDIIDTANMARYRDGIQKVLLPRLRTLEGVLIEIAIREADTVQIGRTHGQHAVPITFGFTIAEYVSRLGLCIETLTELTNRLCGKFSGAVGAHNASSLFFDDPEEFEREVLAEMDLAPADYSNQIIPPEQLARVLSELTNIAGVFAKLSRDMRNLQRSEIGEVHEEFGEAQVGSSTMPQKRNPIDFENVESCWKIAIGKMATVYMDAICEHQRDMTNGASMRTYPELIAYVGHMAKRLARTMKKLRVDKEQMRKNLEMGRGLYLAEPLYIVLSKLGHPDAHEKVRVLTLETERGGQTFQWNIAWDAEIRDIYKPKMTSWQLELLSGHGHYIGTAARKARTTAERWKERLGL